MALLDRVSSPHDLRQMTIAEMKALAQEIRALIIETTARTGGHLAPSLGVVELTLAIHYVFDTPKDRVVWDVGHQCYAHKIVTGRRARFHTLRQYKGIAGFPKRAESEYDVFDTGHSGNSISVTLGAAVGDRLQSRDRRSIAVIGDGSVVAGMAFEALNHGGCLKQDLVVILNDNEMSIARSTGAMAGYLNRMITGRMYNRLRADVWNLLGHLPENLTEKSRLAARKLEEGLKNLVVPSILFEELGFRYIGPVDGHNLAELVDTLRRVRTLRGPVLVHVVTRKGEGYRPAVERPEVFHGTGPFDPETGRPTGADSASYTSCFGNRLVELAAQDDRIVAITAGMCLGTGLARFRDQFPNRFFDVGICEQHAVTFAAGLALAGLKPVVAVYSTFLTRALDQLLQDVCLQNLPVVFAIDRAGLVGEDGPTHHGAFDISYLTMLPGITVMAPMDLPELEAMLQFALTSPTGPTALRYPRGSVSRLNLADRPPIEPGRSALLRDGTDGCVIALGSAAPTALCAAQQLADQGIDLAVINARFAKPIDTTAILAAARRHSRLAVVEENVLAGGFGTAVSLVLDAVEPRPRTLLIGLPDRFIEHGSRDQLLETVGLSVDALVRQFTRFFVQHDSSTPQS
ncbi:MAG: 1-deoxy-D-xylulose-5-phosphate synthase [candidate division WOR-3 bacterium]